MTGKPFTKTLFISALLLLLQFALFACGQSEESLSNITLTPSSPVEFDYEITGSKTKKLIFEIDNPGQSANLSLLDNDQVLVDNLNISQTGSQTISVLVRFNALGNRRLQLKTINSPLTIKTFTVEDIEHLPIPQFKDISVQAGLDKVNSIKYGGPSVADIDQDGDYDFIVNNHNAESSKIYWNNGDGTITKYKDDLSRWFMQDLHGTALGDYDNDGDLDMVLTRGGGNGTNPSVSYFYQNDNSNFVRYTGDVGIDRGARGRGARYSDMDLDGDLDLMLVNETGLANQKPQHFFYENNGQGGFTFKSVPGIQDVRSSRALVSDLNGDNIDDIVMYGPVSVWQGNGDFTYTDISDSIPSNIRALNSVMAVTDIDIDNDGDLDMYLARGKEFEHGKGETPSVDFDPIARNFSLKTRGYKGVDEFSFKASGALKLHNYHFLGQNGFRGKAYPIYLGKDKISTDVPSGGTLEFDKTNAQGWPDDISADGVYFGHVGNDHWRAALVRNGDIFWSYFFTLSGVEEATPNFIPENRNIQDVLLENRDGKFVDVTQQWNIPAGGNALGVTTGDFNNDGHQDLFVYRWGLVEKRISDLMLLNTGRGSFETVTMHGASDLGGPGFGDMGQAFDFDLDGNLDILSGSEYGQWYLYSNQPVIGNNYALVRVGYSPKNHVDALGAQITLQTASHTYQKRIGSAGEVFSQSLLNIAHFGLGKEDKISHIQVRWRNGETVSFSNKQANKIFDTNALDPATLAINTQDLAPRSGDTLQLKVTATPENASQDVHWHSNDPTVAQISPSGLLKMVGKVGESTMIMATSTKNALSAKAKITVHQWYAKPITSVTLSTSKTKLIVGEVQRINANIAPEGPDNAQLSWTSSAPEIASVDADGTLHALTQGQVKISAQAEENADFHDELQFTVEADVKPYIKIENLPELNKTPIHAGQTFEVHVNYHAGTGNKVIAADEGGLRVWFRHFKTQRIPIEDRIQTDTNVLYTMTGSSTATVSTKGLMPTDALPKGQFYSLNVSFTASNGKTYNDSIEHFVLIK